MATPSPSWLTARPIAHRGLHDRAAGIVENSPSAAAAAIARGFAIECDIQLSADGEAVVFHDYTLERLTGTTGRVDSLPVRTLAGMVLRQTADRIPTLPAFLDLIGGRVALFCEIKSRFDGDMRLARRAAACAAAYSGPLSFMSFDPAIVAYLRANRSGLGIGHVPLGMIAMADYGNSADEWAHLSGAEKHALANFLHFGETRPDFLSYAVFDLPHAVPFLCREGMGIPVTTWTVRTSAEIATARRWADQIVFEGFLPEGSAG